MKETNLLIRIMAVATRTLVAGMCTLLITANAVGAEGKKRSSKSAKSSTPAEAVALPGTGDTPPPAPESGEAVDVSKITEKYWAQGKESELGVVQNRKYTYANKFELGAFGGIISSDPFLKVNHYGLSLGYHFSPMWSVHVLGWKTSVSPSAALKTFEAESNSTTNTNEPKGFYGAEVDANLLYGKVSLLGSVIIYVDLFLLGGAGVTDTETGKNFTPFLGLGQKIHLNRFMALHLDYRMMRYSETIRSKNPALNHAVVGTRSNTTDAITLGIDFSY